MDRISQMLAFSILRILAGEEELRWYVGAQLSLYVQRSALSAASGERLSALRVRRLAAVAPSASFCCGVEADDECGQRSCWLLSTESVYSSSIQDGLSG